MKAQLHRSITFWSGILVMAFICWAWWDSQKHWTQCSQDRWTLKQEHSSLVVEIRPPHHKVVRLIFSRNEVLHFKKELFPAPLFFATTKEVPDPKSARRGTFRRFILESVTQMPVGSQCLLIPHWLLLLAVAFPWSVIVLWRVQRRKRLA